MGVLTLNWNNAAVLASANATGQRASKRIKAVGGAFDITGFTPSNDLLKSANTVNVNIINNRVYEFKIEALCIIGGPTPNNNGLREGLVFVCIAPSFVTTFNSVTVNFNLLNTDITKVRVRLKKQSDDSIIGTVTASNVANVASAIFSSGVDAATAYYVEVELYSIINGVEIISSAANFLNAVCGGNISGYQVQTDDPPSCAIPANLQIQFLTGDNGIFNGAFVDVFN
jgi:hypothetical protein